MNVEGFHHVAVQARDVASVAAFYQRVLQLPELRRFHRPDGSLRSIWLGVSAQRSSLASEPFLAIEAASAMAEEQRHLGYSMVALRIKAAERRAVERDLEQAGVAIEKQTQWTVYFKDPEGNLVGLSHYPDDV